MEDLVGTSRWAASVILMIDPFIAGGPPRQPKNEEKKEINNKKFYELLGADSTASESEIRRAFRKKAIKEHPDKGGDPEKVPVLFFSSSLSSNKLRMRMRF